MRYSRWRPATGGYEYFESTEQLGLGDDLPVPDLSPIGGIGVPSTDVGRVPPGGLRRVGSGPVAQGSVMPMSRAGLSLSGVTFGFSLGTMGALLLGAVTGWWWRGRRR